MSPPESRPNCALELCGQLRNAAERPQLLVVREVADLGEGLGTDQRAHAHRVRRIEDLPRHVGRQEGVHLLLRGHVHALVGVGEDEPVHAHHHRAGELLGEAERLDVQVERLLVGLGVELDPARRRAPTCCRSGRSRY
jgi:hypothetical protein